MRKVLLVVIAAIVVSVAIYSGIGADSYLLLRIGEWAMQMSLFVAFLLAAALVILTWAILSIFRGLVLGAWPAAWRNRREKNLTRAAIENLALSNWRSAQKEFTRLANKTDNPVPLIMLSAQTSEAMGDFEEAKSVYQQTLEEFPEWSYAVRSRLCNIALVEGELEEAEVLLDELKTERKNDTHLLALEVRLAEDRRDWSSLQQALLSALKKPEIRSQIAPVERRYLHARLSERPGAPELLELIDYVTVVDNTPADTIAQLAKQLAMRGHGVEAEALVRKTLNKNWEESLVSTYAELEAKSPKKQLKNAETWLSAHSESKALVSSLQKLAIRAGDDAKADAYFAQLEDISAESKKAQKETEALPGA